MNLRESSARPWPAEPSPNPRMSSRFTTDFSAKSDGGPMNPTWSHQIDEVLSTGRSLHSSGVHNWVLSRDQALNALDALEALAVPVLGGDVYVEIDNRIRSCGENWYYDADEDESPGLRVQRSIEKARDYIGRHPASLALFALVPDAAAE